MFQGSLKGVSRKFQESFRRVSMVFRGSLREFQKSFHVVSIMSDDSFKGEEVSKVFQGYFKVKEVSRVFWDCFKEV